MIVIYPVMRLIKNAGNFLFLLLLSIMLVTGCMKENYYTGTSARLSFSTDTLVFDTVFTSIGTVTHEFMVYNKNSYDLLISSIDIAGAANSGFRFNVDGREGTELKDIPILANDSLYVFMEATIDPLNSGNPMVIFDSVVFITNTNVQDVKLVAWGQDVHLVNGEVLTSGTWINDKPYLVYNSALIDTLNTLRIDPGVRVYFHKGSTLYICGTLKVMGTIDEPVLFAGDRLDEMYKDIPGQWNGLYFVNGSRSNEIINTSIINAVSGIHLGNLYSADPAPDLVLRNSVVSHMTWAGLSSLGGSITASNCEISDCGYFTAILSMGGSYEFMHCTFANYWGWSQRRTPSLLLSDNFIYNDTALFVGDLLKADFGNCIIYGDHDTELAFSDYQDAGDFNYLFEHCLLKADTSVNTSDLLHFTDPVINIYPGFVDKNDSDFQLDTLAFAQDKAFLDISVLFPYDLMGRDRLADDGPDLGAYERIENISQ